MQDLPKKNTEWKEDLFCAMKLAPHKLRKYYTEVTPTSSMLRLPAHILHPFQSLRLFRMWDKGMDINLEDETS